MTLIIIHEAEVEFNESVLYYESKQKGLGVRFRDEVETIVNLIIRNPEFPRLRPKGYGRVNLRVFQHYVSYIIRGNVIWIVAIAHAHRRPEFWLKRITQ